MSRGDAGRGAPYVVRGRWMTSLQFKGDVTQSRMWNWAPDLLQVGYTRSMLAVLALCAQPQRIGIIGLGGGSQAKFCHRHLPQARIEAIEADAGVLAVRDAFRIPDDGERFSAVHGDAASLLRRRRGAYDVLLVDAYDAHGIPSALSTADWYHDCRASLVPGGAMSCNLYDTDIRRHLAHLRKAFDHRVRVLDEPGMDNKVAFAWTDDAAPFASAGVSTMPWWARRQIAPGLARLTGALKPR